MLTPREEQGDLQALPRGHNPAGEDAGTLGLFLIVINALMLLLTSAIVRGFSVHGFTSAALAGLVLGVFNLFANIALRRISNR